MNAVQQNGFLRIPPFPGARPSTFAVQLEGEEAREDADTDRLLSLVRELKVGGDYWASQPPMPEEPYTLVRISDYSERSRILADLPSARSIACWTDSPATAAVTARGPVLRP